MLYSPEPMHIPDGFLSVAVSILMWGASIVVIAYALRRVSADLDERKVPLMGVLAAAIFAGQMLNFTVIGGTSGHLMGAAIARTRNFIPGRPPQVTRMTQAGFPCRGADLRHQPSD